MLSNHGLQTKRGFSKTLALSAIAVSLIICGCATDEKPSTQTDLNDSALVQSSLASAANDVYSEVKRLNAGTRLPDSSVIIQHPVTGCSTRFVSIDFDGPADVFWKNLGKTGFCKIRVLGKKPPIDLVLDLHHFHEPLWHVIEDAGVQIGNSGSVEVTSDTIIVKYHDQFYTGVKS